MRPRHDLLTDVTATRIVIMGNAGSGKSTLAARLAMGRPCLSLDAIAWREGTIRRPLDESLMLLRSFIQANQQWIIEGCYGELIEPALTYCEELIFLNPGVEACVERCCCRKFEPDKFANPEAQDSMMAALVEWVQQYETRDDEFGLSCHRRLFDGFRGRKREILE